MVIPNVEEDDEEEEDVEEDGEEATGVHDLEAFCLVSSKLENTSVKSPNRANGIRIKEVNQRKIEEFFFQKRALRVQFLFLSPDVLLPKSEFICSNFFS